MRFGLLLLVGIITLLSACPRCRGESMYKPANWLVSVSTSDYMETAITPYEDLIYNIAMEEGVDPQLLKAVIKQESKFNPKAKSPKGAYGLMQLMPSTAGIYNVDRFNVKENITGGARYLKALLDRYGDIKLALASYNAGEGAVANYGGVPPYPETQRYIRKVMAQYKEYKGWD